MNAAAKKTDFDLTAAEAVRNVAVSNDEGAFHGYVATETMEFLYLHLSLLAAEIVKSVLGLPTPEITLSVDKNNKRQLGHYKIGRDGLGLKWRISLNVLHLAAPKAQVVAVLLHEVLHAVQCLAGKPGKGNYHNAEFLSWCEKAGIPTNSRGIFKGISENSPFAEYVKRHGLDGNLGLVKKDEVPKPKGSRLRKYVCGCGVIVRVASDDFQATCNECDTEFVKD